jgi:hypothetical protein
VTDDEMRSPRRHHTAQAIRALIRLATDPQTPEAAETLIRSIHSEDHRVALTAAILVFDLAEGKAIDPSKFDLLLEDDADGAEH